MWTEIIRRILSKDDFRLTNNSVRQTDATRLKDSGGNRRKGENYNKYLI
jgi:hypothetical protein